MRIAHQASEAWGFCLPSWGSPVVVARPSSPRATTTRPKPLPSARLIRSTVLGSTPKPRAAILRTLSPVSWRAFGAASRAGRSGGAILSVSPPAMIVTSHLRGLDRRAKPKRSTSSAACHLHHLDGAARQSELNPHERAHTCPRGGVTIVVTHQRDRNAQTDANDVA
jgi:hypothetical protein